MNNFLVAIAGLICTILLAAIFAPYFINWNSFKGEIETIGRKVTGQNVQIVGDVELRILPQPVFHTGGMIITNADGKKLIETNDFVMELDFPSLLRGKIEVTSMHLNDGKITVAKTENASLNLFNFGGNIGQPIGLEDVSIEKLNLTNMEIEFANEVSNVQKTISIKQAEVTARSLTGPFRMKGILNVAADDTIFERVFSASIGKYASEKPLSVKIQIDGEQKGSRLGFLGNLVGLEDRPLLTGKMSINGKKGENLIGYGQDFGSVLTDNIFIESDISISYAAMELEKFKFEMGAKDANKLTDGLIINGNLNYAWGRKPALNGAVNIGVADYNYIQQHFLSTAEGEAAPVYQSMLELSANAQDWMEKHLIIRPEIVTDGVVQSTDFNGNISVNIDQLNFVQNNIIDRVRLINSLVKIENNQISMPQFSALFPGNGKLSYALSRQAGGQSEEKVMTGEYDFSILHLSKLFDWFLFKNAQKNQFNGFWDLNDQMISKGSIDLLSSGIEVKSPSVKTRNYEYGFGYTQQNGAHEIAVNFAKVALNNADFTEFQRYIGAFAHKAYIANPQVKQPNIYHLLPLELLTDIGQIELKLHSDESYYGIRNLGVLDAEFLFDSEHTKLTELSLAGDKIYLTAKGNLPHKYTEKSIVDADKDEPVLEFSIIDAEMKLTPQLVHNLLLEDNLFLNKVIPLEGPLNVTGRLDSTNDRGDFYLNLTGKVGTSELDIGVEIATENQQLVQKDVLYQLTVLEVDKLLRQFGLEGLLNVEAQTIQEAGVVKLAITQNAENANIKDVKFQTVMNDQLIELTAEQKLGQGLNLAGDLQLDVANIGLLAQQFKLFDGNFNRLQGRTKFDAKLEITDDKLQISSNNMHVFNSNFNKFKLDISQDNSLNFESEAESLDVKNLLSLFSGESKSKLVETEGLLADAAQNVIKSAQAVFGTTDAALPAGFDLTMLKNIEFKGNISVKKLTLSPSLTVDNAVVQIQSNADDDNLQIKFEGGFFNTKLKGEFNLKPADNRLHLDVIMQSFGLNVVPLTAALGYENQYLAGLVDVDLDLTGQGYSVDGLIANLAGSLDVDLKQLGTNHINSGYFNDQIGLATNEAEIDTIFSNFIIRDGMNEAEAGLKILPEKITFAVSNGIASITHKLNFQMPNSKNLAAQLSGQMDLTGDISRFALQIPLANDAKAPKLLLEWLSADDINAENVNFSALQEYYKVKLLEKNVQRLEALQVEIKRKNDAEIARYQQEKIEAETFKNEIKLRVENAINERKMREMVAQNPPIPTLMPYMFVEGTSADISNDNSSELGQNSLMNADIVNLVAADLAAQKAIEEQAAQEAAEALRLAEEKAIADALAKQLAAEKAAADAELKRLEEAAADAQAQKLIDESQTLEFIPDGGDSIADILDSTDSLLDGSFTADENQFDNGNLTDQDNQINFNAPTFNQTGSVLIEPLPPLQ